MIADILLIAGALGAAFYCMVLSRRLRRFADLESGVGGAVAVLSMQVDDMTKSIRKAETAAGESAARLDELTARSESAARRLELMIAAMHDLPVDTGQTVSPPPGEEAAPSASSAPSAPGREDAPADTVPAAGRDEARAETKKRPQTIFSSRRAFAERAA
jgi:hypothetical protein